MDYPTPEHESFVLIPHIFFATRIYEEEAGVPRLSATEITLKISCAPIETNTTPKDSGQRAIIGFQRLKTWLSAVLTDVVLINVNSDLFDNLQACVGNQLMYVPGQPDDAMLAVLLHSKISAITKDFLEVTNITLSATDTEHVERYYRRIDEYPLPGIEYFDAELIHDTPWWNRPTIDICEYAKEDTKTEQELFWHEHDPLAEIGKEYLKGDSEADIIAFDIWKSDDS